MTIPFFMAMGDLETNEDGKQEFKIGEYIYEENTLLFSLILYFGILLYAYIMTYRFYLPKTSKQDQFYISRGS